MSQRNAAVASDITTDDLAKVSRTRVFFGHQSVGMNVLAASPASMRRMAGMASPTIEQDGTAAGQDGGFVDHAFIGREREAPAQDPGLRREDALGHRPAGRRGDDEALLCRHHEPARTSSALFATYRKTVAALEQDFPKVTFVHVTVPLMTEQGLLSKLKSRLTGSSRYAAAQRTRPRERLNALIRREYAGDHLFDLAAIESTAPDGSRACRHVPGAAVLPTVRRLRFRLRAPQWRGCPGRSHRVAEGDRPGLPEVAIRAMAE